MMMTIIPHEGDIIGGQRATAIQQSCQAMPGDASSINDQVLLSSATEDDVPKKTKDQTLLVCCFF
eukprot:scaffold115032_cov26-Cyclotella_meneghiniana.AAC.1